MFSFFLFRTAVTGELLSLGDRQDTYPSHPATPQSAERTSTQFADPNPLRYLYNQLEQIQKT